jgi:tetratricopeptide (TPR) repeat protein
MIKKQIEDLVEEGRLEEALDQLTEYLKTNASKYDALIRSAQITQSAYFLEKNRELQGLLSAEEIRQRNAKAANGILDILRQMDLPQPVPFQRRPMLWVALGGVLLLGLGLLLGPKIFSNRQTPIEPIPEDSTDNQGYCPTYSNTALYRIAIIPFLTRTGATSQTNPAESLLRAFGDIFNRVRFDADAELLTKFAGFDDANDAKEIRENCGCQMVLSGQVFDENNERISINFFTNSFDPKQERDVDSLLRIREMGSFQSNMEQAALIIASRIMLSMNRTSDAVAFAEEAYRNEQKAQQNNPKRTKQVFPAMTLAQAYTHANQPVKAIDLYNEVLTLRPMDTIAIGNKSVLQFKTQQLDSALVSAEIAAKVKKSKAGWHLLQSEIHSIKGENKEAWESAKRAEAIKPNNTMIKNRLQELNTKIKRPIR